MTNKYIYVGDIDADIDDLVAIEYMKHVDRLGAVVLDGHSRNESREHTIDRLRIPVLSFIPVGTSVVFCGGALTKVAEYLKSGNSLDLLVVNGGFAGDNLVPRINRLKKFSGKNTVRTFNFNLDVEAADYVLTYGDIKKIVMVSKNVCHSELNTLEHLYKDDTFLQENYKHTLRPGKRLHDLLMVKEGLAIIDGKETICEYIGVLPLLDRSDIENMSKWGSILSIYSRRSISFKYKLIEGTREWAYRMILQGNKVRHVSQPKSEYFELKNSQYIGTNTNASWDMKYPENMNEIGWELYTT